MRSAAAAAEAEAEAAAIAAAIAAAAAAAAVEVVDVGRWRSSRRARQRPASQQKSWWRAASAWLGLVWRFGSRRMVDGGWRNPGQCLVER